MKGAALASFPSVHTEAGPWFARNPPTRLVVIHLDNLLTIPIVDALLLGL